MASVDEEVNVSRPINSGYIMNNYTMYGGTLYVPEIVRRVTTDTCTTCTLLFALLVIILISTVVICMCSNFCCYQRGVKQGRKLNQKNDQLQEPAQYQGQNTSNEISDQEHAYEKPRPPTIETSQNNELELSAYEEVKENQFEEFQYQKIDEDVYLTPVFRQYPLSSAGTWNEESAYMYKQGMVHHKQGKQVIAVFHTDIFSRILLKSLK